MNLIYIVTEAGGQQAYEEAQVHEMLAQQILSPETLFWQEGMAEWRPLSELPPRKGSTIAPARRPEGPTDPFASLRESDTSPPRELSERARKQKAYRRFFFRKNPVPLTVSIQLLTAISVALGACFIWLCVDKIYGWSSPYDPSTMTNVLSSASKQVEVSSSDKIFLFDFLGGLFLIHVVIEILFFRWVYIANKNSRVFATNIRFQPDWAVMCFFVPVANFFRPYHVIQEIWKVSENPRSWIGRRDSIYVGFWFLVRWSFLGLVPLVYNGFFSDVDDPADRTESLLILLLATAADIALIEITTLILVSLVTWRQRKWVRQMNQEKA